MDKLPLEDQTTRTSLELLYHISRELSAALDLRMVLQRVLYLSMQNVGASNGTIIVLDNEGNPIDSVMILGDQLHDHTTRNLDATLERGLAGWVVRNQQAALVMDTSQDERWIRRDYEAQGQINPKSAVSAPLKTRDMLVGVMTLVHPQPGYFTREHLALIQAIADQAGIAVLNARLYAESQRQARVMTALAESAGTINASLSLVEVLTGIMDHVSRALGTQAVSLGLIEPDLKTLSFRIAIGGIFGQVVNLRQPIGEGIAGWVMQHGVGVIVPDVSKDQRFDPAINQHLGFVTRAIGCAPIRYRGEVIGVIEALNPLEENFDADALLVLTGIGSLAGAAIRHAQLFERLDAAHARFRGLFEDSIDPILITDWDGKILQTNRRAALVSDYSQADLQQMTIQQFHAIDAEQLGAGFEHLHTGNIYSYESRLRSRCGHEIPIEVHVRKVEMDECVNIQWMLRDITERKNLETLRNDLISMIYHDLRSPLANVVSSLDVLKTMLPGDDHALRSLLEIALRSTERIQRLTESLLDMNRLEAGQPLGNRQMVQPGVLIQEALDAVRPIIDNKHQTAVTEIPEETSPVFVDAEMIRRVLINLLENAAKYTPAGSMLTMGAMNVGEKVQFWIRDNGPGIPTSEHERIFEKFSRLTSKGTPRGFGLGLAYCRLAVEGHGGRIWVESEPGTGACFQFTLPTSAE